MSSERYDVVVTGGGPGGSAVAAAVARAGHRVLLLERETLPHPRISGSLPPGTVRELCGQLGVADELARELGQAGAVPPPESMGPAAYDHYMERAAFDWLLLDALRKHGVDVRENCAAVNVMTENERVTGLRYRTAEGRGHTVLARYVVDASGAGSRLRRHLGGTRSCAGRAPDLAVHACFEGGGPLPAAPLIAGSARFWHVPLGDGLTCVGAVVGRELADRVHRDPERALLGLAEDCPPVREFLAAATRVRTGPYGQVQVRADWSYADSRFWKPGMVLVGDAACAADPPLASGVELACHGGLLAARALNDCLDHGTREEAAFAEFERRYREAYFSRTSRAVGAASAA
ncbi:FAD-dependent oxidoreductase [Streptomyces sp. NPDC050315]|uniref:NAD(P)/FAD-dependent oxidoreductase n=1 Tax=Streptomyces sp. NPDC050315 TaxID=3155039 RepID=UPI003425ED01